MEPRELIIIIELGSQYSHLIARRIRGLGVYTDISIIDALRDKHIPSTVKGMILSGGPGSVVSHEEYIQEDILEYLLTLKVPILGICLGHQLIAKFFGGTVVRGERGEYGLAILNLRGIHCRLVDGLPKSFRVWMSHKDTVIKEPDGFKNIGYTKYTPVAIMCNDGLKIYGVQFHPEVSHTEYGDIILRNFVYKICRCRGGWSPEDYIENYIRQHSKLSSERAIMAISGGIDSTVTALILHKIFHDNLNLVFIDNGLLREKEGEWVKSLFSQLGLRNLHFIDASKTFLRELRGVSDPEEKRRTISNIFIRIFREYAEELGRKIGEIKYLGQGTIYPDIVESGKASRYTDKIKSHHNVSMSITYGFKILEPLRYFYKDEVRRVAKYLGLPRELIERHPFPGPGLAIRIVGEVTDEKLNILRRVDRIVEEEVRKAGLYKKYWQAFPILLSIKSVGVKGDRRVYGYVIVLRFVESRDAMTARFSRLDWDFLENLSSRIMNEVDEVSRVLYDISNKPPATIEFE